MSKLKNFKPKSHKATKKRVKLTAGGGKNAKVRFRKNRQSHLRRLLSGERRLKHRKDNIANSTHAEITRLAKMNN